MVAHSSTPAWRIPWTEELGRLQSRGITKSQTLTVQFSLSFFMSDLPRPGIKLVSLPFTRWILNHWTTREAPLLCF